MNRQEHSRRMMDMVEQWHQSGLSQKQFSEQQAIHVNKLRYWIAKIRQQAPSGGGFIRLEAEHSAGICLRYPNGVELILPGQTPLSLIKGLVNL